ncbi:MAG: YchJ family protein [Candidatus Methylumidiphilus sp.]
MRQPGLNAMAAALCPCGSGRPYEGCCGPLLAGAAAPTAEALMRSRYTAYARRDAAYLLNTWHPDSRPAVLDFSGDDTQWAGLRILRVADGGPQDAQGTVEFIATYRQHGKIQQLREHSRFTREAGAWRYLDGDILPTTPPGRNDPCPCGSGKKFKKCCG